MAQVGGHAQWRGGRAAGETLGSYVATESGEMPYVSEDPTEALGGIIDVDGLPVYDPTLVGGMRIFVRGDGRIFVL